MYTGWWKPYPINRPLGLKEEDEKLSRDKPKHARDAIEPDDRSSLIRFNSTYADFIDRRFRLRGSAFTTIFIAGLALFLGVIALFISFLFKDPDHWLMYSFGIVFVACCMIAPLVGLRRDFFLYTHYPIRFNRKTRMVHAFLHNGPDGVISVPWDQAYFHIGHGLDDPYFIDVRCHVLEGHMVKQTFAVGHFYDNPDVVKQIWSFIRTYMDEGPEALQGLPPISASVSTGFKNCFLWSYQYCRMVLPIPLVMWVFVALTTPTRWLVLKTCKQPIWPMEVLAESVVEENDPHHWPEPKSSGEFSKDEKVWAAVKARAPRRKQVG